MHLAELAVTEARAARFARGRRARRLLFLTTVVLSLPVMWQLAPAQETSGGAGAQTEPTTTAPVSPEDAARSVLAKHCARCHERGWLWRGMTTVLDAPIDLSSLLRHPDGAQAGRADASRLYTVMLSGHLKAGDTGEGPTADEIDAVRGWIEGASTTSAETCQRRRPVTLDDLGQVLERLRTPGGEALKGIRFISLAGYHNSCASEAVLAAKRETVRQLILRLRTTTVNIDLPFAADGVPLLAVRLGDMGWHASRWDAVAAQADAPTLTDASLADVYGTETPLIDAAALADAASALAHSYVLPLRESSDDHRMNASLHQDRGLLDLVIDGRTDVTLERAATEVGLTVAALDPILTEVAGGQEGAARALRQGSILRGQWNALRPHLTLPGNRGPLRYTVGVHAKAEDERLDVLLWSDKTSYRKGDLVVINAQVNRNCHLNIINVDTRGEATVLFPSDSDPDNAVTAGTKVRVPSSIEPYQLRASETGTETFVAVCAVQRKRMLGVDQDFERQRFSLLGDWRQFLKTRRTREALVGQRQTPRQRRARIKAETAAASATAGEPEREARSAIYVRIE